MRKARITWFDCWYRKISFCCCGRHLQGFANSCRMQSNQRTRMPTQAHRLFLASLCHLLPLLLGFVNTRTTTRESAESERTLCPSFPRPQSPQHTPMPPIGMQSKTCTQRVEQRACVLNLTSLPLVDTKRKCVRRATELGDGQRAELFYSGSRLCLSPTKETAILL